MSVAELTYQVVGTALYIRYNYDRLYNMDEIGLYSFDCSQLHVQPLL